MSFLLLLQRSAIKLAAGSKNHKIILEGDSMEVINALRGHSHVEDWTCIDHTAEGKNILRE